MKESLPELCSWIDKVMKENNFSYEVLLIMMVVKISHGR